MEHPKRQIPTVIHHLTTGTPTDQKSALDTYFLPDASFYHPLCRVPSFSHVKLPLVGQIDSRWVIWMVYRWYKILSPRIELDVECGEFNQETGVLFVEIFQIFSLWFIPFYKSPVHLTTKLSLVKDKKDEKYYIAKQEDLYQLNDILRFFLPGGNLVLSLFQIFATGMCILGALIGWPVTWFFERHNVGAGAKSLKNGS